ncbi:hypothetical protein [Catenulispora rubra]|uniref:hypothetical protein n=1 Tax=Catenulispora rubra TaxID=280293 RepID=UPI001891F819|nr:hypothetical protein [Catenulispora rubra]
MRISRRFSRSTAAGAASVLAALAMSACSSSSSGGGSAASSSAQSQSVANANANENDVQVLNSLQLNTQELDSAFATDSQWKTWPAADTAKLLLKQTWACTQNMIDTSKKSLQPVTSFFMAGPLPGDPPTTPASTTSSSSSSHSNGYNHKSGSSSTPTSTGSSSSSSSTVGADGNPVHWVVSTAIAYQTADAAQAAVSGMGAIDPNAPGCGGPKDGDKDEIVGGGGAVEPSWVNSQGVFVFTDTHTHVTISAVAQRRGRYVVLTYTRGSAGNDAGYYDLEEGSDTKPAAAAATAVLGQLTASVVGTNS